MDPVKRAFALTQCVTGEATSGTGGRVLLLALATQPIARILGKEIPQGLATSAAKKGIAPAVALRSDGPMVDPILLHEMEDDFEIQKLKRLFKAELVSLIPEPPIPDTPEK